MSLSRYVRNPPLSLDEMRQLAREAVGVYDLSKRNAEYDCLELFGQSRALRDGFATLGLKCQSFDISCLVQTKRFVPIKHLFVFAFICLPAFC